MREDKQQNEEWLQRLRSGLGSVERTIQSRAEPSREQLLQWRVDAARIRRRRLVVDLLAFWCVAGLLLFGGGMIAWRAPLVFVILQASAMVVGLIVVLPVLRRRSRR